MDIIIIINKPTGFSKTQLKEVQKLITTGGEVDTEWLETRLIRADLINTFRLSGCNRPLFIARTAYSAV